ncbi:hypothetical protein RFI_32493 [Reticulomyxa filosa]|uniref:Uncharacterized protein n=1 Tax=Reticulomyxa filosa TaxID=46433 RepID=X6LTF7_RETFI|nr:hypothetical protein RFI_32493 [Reticulomyxa filosa]|eukprot:ETO04904.1 hypothetical protein RFI_32493 [Reticulomyxa filosa]
MVTVNLKNKKIKLCYPKKLKKIENDIIDNKILNKKNINIVNLVDTNTIVLLSKKKKVQKSDYVDNRSSHELEDDVEYLKLQLKIVSESEQTWKNLAENLKIEIQEDKKTHKKELEYIKKSFEDKMKKLNKK